MGVRPDGQNRGLGFMNTSTKPLAELARSLREGHAVRIVKFRKHSSNGSEILKCQVLEDLLFDLFRHLCGKGLNDLTFWLCHTSPPYWIEDLMPGDDLKLGVELKSRSFITLALLSHMGIGASSDGYSF